MKVNSAYVPNFAHSGYDDETAPRGKRPILTP